MKTRTRIFALYAIIILAGFCMARPALSSTMNFNGALQYHNDVVKIDLYVSENWEEVIIWTDSFAYGNFDPIIALWKDGALIAYNDDAVITIPTGGGFDSGLGFASLESGSYILTLSAYANFPASGLLSEGYMLDNEAPIAMADWCGPEEYECDILPQWNLHVESPSIPAIPEPATYLMLLSGLGLLGAIVRRRRNSP